MSSLGEDLSPAMSQDIIDQALASALAKSETTTVPGKADDSPSNGKATPSPTEYKFKHYKPETPSGRNSAYSTVTKGQENVKKESGGISKMKKNLAANDGENDAKKGINGASNHVLAGEGKWIVTTPSSTQKKRGLTSFDEEDYPGSVGPSTPRKRRAPATPVSRGKKVSTSLEEASEEDLMIWEKRQAGVPWSEVRATWEEMTGEKVGNSTLPNRYDRLRVNFLKMKEVDEIAFLKSLTEVDNKFANEKWTMVSEKMVSEHGTEKYPPKALEKAWNDIKKRPSFEKAVAEDEENLDSDV
ncbi:MAG: hypothetical protein M4579_000667 [Chaenotheca gracillima]|nr:MAG: hypothetical protein M4579_000667 [Chaenotheca gracillima]